MYAGENEANQDEKRDQAIQYGGIDTNTHSNKLPIKK